MRDLSIAYRFYRLKECGLTTLETRRLVMKILILIFFFEIKEIKITRGHNYMLVKKQSRLDVRKYSFSQRTITQIYVTIEKDVSIESALARIETCIIEVAAWMARNDLKLNAEKSQAILFQPLKHGVNKQPEVCVEVAGRRIALSTSVRNIGVVFDSRLSMEEQVAQTAKSCYSRTPGERPPSPTTIPLIRPHFV